MEDKMALLAGAENPRRATLDDAACLSKLFASAFEEDPLFDYMVRPGAGRAAALEIVFRDILSLTLANFEVAHRLRGTRNIGSFSTIS